MRSLILLAGAAALGMTAPAVSKNHKGGHGHHGKHGAGPPGLAKKGGLPPGQAKKFNVGDRYGYPIGGYNVPSRYRDRYHDDEEHVYRYRDGYLYEIDRDNGLITEIVRLLGL